MKLINNSIKFSDAEQGRMRLDAKKDIDVCWGCIFNYSYWVHFMGDVAFGIHPYGTDIITHTASVNSNFCKEYYLYVRGKSIFAALKRGALVDAVTLFKRPSDLKYSFRRISLIRSLLGKCGTFSKYKSALK